MALGMLDRDGDLRTVHTTNLRSANVKGIVAENVEPGSTVMTDEHASFVGLAKHYTHRTVNHSYGEYVRGGGIHTNGIEGVWSLLKRQFIGIHHVISKKHLSRYLDEMTWRFNRRIQREGERLANLLADANGKRMTYKVLIA